MCGIFYSNKILEQPIIDSMFKTLEKRGPDAQGLYKRDFLICHTRLAIIDLDKRSNQPMNFKGYVVSFNGEIYNYIELKRTLLKDYDFKTSSDTEVIIALYHKFGIEGWKHLRGIYAFIFYHESRNKIYFLRDPLGVKPLYYYYYNGRVIVASKISTILAAIPNPKLDYKGVNEILAYGYPRKPIYQNILEIEPGFVYDKNLQKIKVNYEINKKKTIKDAIIEQFVNSDRPVGVLLSGGIDSSYIAYVCSKISKKKIHTYTIGFSKDDEDVRYAKELATYIGSEHHEIIINAKEYETNLWEGIEKLEQPMDLGSVSLTNAIGKEIAKTNIKVLLSGDSNDEVSGGYRRYAEKNGLRTSELWEWYKTRIVKNDYETRKKILGFDNAMPVDVYDDNYPDNSNKILWCDVKNELRYYHLRRMDHIISDFSIELRVPYADFDFVMNSFNESFAKKVNQRGDKLLVRDFAVKDGLPEKFAFRKKVPMKSKDFDAPKHLQMIWQKWKKDHEF